MTPEVVERVEALVATYLDPAGARDLRHAVQVVPRDRLVEERERCVGDCLDVLDGLFGPPSLIRVSADEETDIAVEGLADLAGALGVFAGVRNTDFDFERHGAFRPRTQRFV